MSSYHFLGQCKVKKQLLEFTVLTKTNKPLHPMIKKALAIQEVTASRDLNLDYLSLISAGREVFLDSLTTYVPLCFTSQFLFSDVHVPSPENGESNIKPPPMVWMAGCLQRHDLLVITNPSSRHARRCSCGSWQSGKEHWNWNCGVPLFF
ncbi:hypothetical protein J6590_084259 [Homalodisca vitripennis]|nr:hypothetical protein J6590_084259 [Homalodisca vitripennis]